MLFVSVAAFLNIIPYFTGNIMW